MTDLATLGLKIDSSQAASANRELDRLSASSKKAEDAQAGLERASRKSAAAHQAEGQAIGNAYGIREQMAKGQVAVIKNYEQMIGKQTLLNAGLGREAAQYSALRKAGVSADTDYGRTVKELAGHLYDLEQATTKANSSTGNWVNTLTRRFVIGFLVTQLRGLLQTIVDINREAAKTADVGRFTGIGGQNIQGLLSTGAVSGIDSAKMLDDMTAFSRELAKAKQGTGDLATLFRANGIAVKDTADAFDRVADLVRNAKDDVAKFSILQQAGLPATREWVKFMEQGSAAIRQAGDEFSKLTDQQLADMERLEKRWNTLFNSASRWGKSFIVDLFNPDNWNITVVADSFADKFLQALSGRVPKVRSKLADAMFGGTGGNFGGIFAPNFDFLSGQPDPKKTTVDPKDQIAALQRQNEQIGLLGDLATASQKATVAGNNLTLAWLQQGVSAGKNRQAILDMQATIVQGAAIQIRAANGIVSADELMQQKKRELAIQVFNGTMTQQQANASLENYARHARDAADAAAVYASKFPALTQASLDAQNVFKQFDQFGVNSVDKFASTLTDIASGSQKASEAFRQLGLSVVQELNKMIIKAMLFKLISAAFGSPGTPTIGAPAGQMFGGADLSQSAMGGGFGGGVFASARGNVFSGPITPFARGGIVNRPTLFPMANGAGLMGEAGPEAVIPLRRGPDGVLGVGARGGGGVHVTYAPVYSVQGSGKEIDELRLQIMKDRAEAPTRILRAVRDARRRGEL